MQVIGRQPQRAPDGAPVQYERHPLEQTTLYRLLQRHAATSIAEIGTATKADMPRCVKSEFEAFLEPALRRGAAPGAAPPVLSVGLSSGARGRRRQAQCPGLAVRQAPARRTRALQRSLVQARGGQGCGPLV